MKQERTSDNPLPERSKTKLQYERQLSASKLVLQKMVQEVRQLLEPTGLTPAIKYRIKSFDAYFDKLRKQAKSSHAKRTAPISDFFAMRIVCFFLEDIDTVEKLLCSHFDIVQTESKAEQHSFREFGYDSVHLAAKINQPVSGSLPPGVRKICEIQLRTILQDAWAEVEHELVYKSDISLPNQSIRRKLASLNATLTLSDLIFQEIRDYQKTLRKQGHSRRFSLEEKIDSMQLLVPSSPLASTAGLRDAPSPIPSVMTSRLEKLMLRALEAHSDQDLEGAISHYTQILGMKLEHKVRSLVYNHRGMAYLACDDTPKALRDFTQAIRYDQESERSYLNRGFCQRRRNKHALARKDFEQALKLNPSLADGYLGCAQANLDLGDLDQARSDCDKALEIDPGYQPALELKDKLQQDE
ncbi:MAG: tetratricopeptide repeat protein [Desulfuromonadales bacterium]|nr:tetratricopeptide repeat protein [Desulfuromonadales bacterium]